MSVLLITGGSQVQEYVFKKYNFGYFCSEFNIVLDKYGFLDYDKVTFEELPGFSFINQYDFLIVTWLPPELWKDKYTNIIKKFKGRVFLEGPFHESVKRELGLTLVSNIQEASGELIFEESTLKEIGFSPQKVITLNPPKIHRSKIFKPQWPNFPCKEKQGRCNISGDVLYNYANIHYNRYNAKNVFNRGRLENAIAFYCVVDVLDKLPEGDTKDTYKDKLRKICESVANNIPSEKIKSKTTLSFYYAAIEKLKIYIGDVPKLTEVVKVYEDDSVEFWDLLTEAILSNEIDSKVARSEVEKILNGVTGKSLSYIDLITVAFVAKSANCEAELDKTKSLLLDKLQLKEFGDHILSEIKVKGDELFQLLIILWMLGIKERVVRLTENYIKGFVDLSTGLVQSADYDKGKWVPRKNLLGSNLILISPWFMFLLSLICDRIVDVERGSDEIGRFYSEEMIEKWKRFPVLAESVAGDGIETLAWWNQGNEKKPAIFRKSSVIAFNFQIFNFICYHYTIPPTTMPPRLIDVSNAIALEEFFVNLLTQEAKNSGAMLCRVNPWPYGKKFCYSIRKDVDRIPDEKTFKRLLEWEIKENLGVSWYWIANRLDKNKLLRIKQAGHEIGLHSVKIKRKRKETGLIRKEAGCDIYGECTHQGGGSDEWLGPMQIIFCRELGMKYAITQFTHNYPFRFLDFKEGGEVSHVEDIWLLSYTGTVDKVRKSQEQIYEILKVEADHLYKGYYTIVSNHPDMNFDILKNFTESLPKDGRVNWTVNETIDWWTKTHDSGKLRIRKIHDSPNEIVYIIQSTSRVQNLCLTFIEAAEKKLIPESSDNITFVGCEKSGEDLLVGISIDEGESRLTFRHST